MTIKRGLHTIAAASKIAKPKTLSTMPPTNGIYPKIYTIGSKKMQIPSTIKAYPPILNKYVILWLNDNLSWISYGIVLVP